MRPMIRFLRRRGRPPSKNAWDRSSKVNNDLAAASSTGKELKLGGLGSASPQTSPSKDSAIDASAGVKAVRRETDLGHTKVKISAGGNRMTTRASAASVSGADLATTQAAPAAILSRTQNLSSISDCDGKEVKQNEALDMPQKSEQRVLRPRGPPGLNATESRRGRRPFVEVKFSDGVAMSILGRRIKVWWPLDSCWYYGLVKKYDRVKNSHWIVYDDGDEEWLDLRTERYKLQMRPGEVLNRSQSPGDTRKTYTALASRRHRQVIEDASKVFTNSNVDQAKIGDVCGRIENLGQAFEHSRIEAREPLKLSDHCEARNGPFDGSAMNMDLDICGNCKSGFPSTCKVTSVYSRRHFGTKQKVHDSNLLAGKQRLDLAAPENSEIDLDASSASLMAERRCTIQETQFRSILQKGDIRQVGVLCSDEKKDSDCNGDMNAVSSNMAYSKVSSCAEAPAIFHVAGSWPVKCDCDAEQVIGQADHFSNGSNQIFCVPSNQTDVFKDLHSGSNILVISLKKNISPDKPPADLIVVCTRREGDDMNAAEMDMHFKKFKGIDFQVSNSRQYSEVCLQHLGHRMCSGQFFLQKIRLDTAEHFQVALDIFELNLRSSESILCEGLLKGSFANQVRAKTLIVKQYLSHDIVIDRSFCGDTPHSVLFKLQSSQLDNSIVIVKAMDQSDEIQEVALNGGGIVGNARGDDVVVYNKGDWPLSFRKCNFCLFTQLNPLYGVANGFYHNGTRSIALQVEFNSNPGIMSNVVKVVFRGSACLGNMLESLRRMINDRNVFDDGLVLRYLGHTSEKADITNSRLNPLALIENAYDFGGSTSSMKPQKRDLDVAGKKNYGSPMETIISNISRDVVKTEQPSESAMRTQQTSSNLALQHVRKSSYSHVKKKRRSDKILKRGIFTLNKDLAENITVADGLADREDGHEIGKRRKLDTERSHGASAKAGEIHQFSNDLDEQTHESSASGFGEACYVISSVPQLSAPKTLQLSSSNEVPSLLHGYVLEDKKSSESKHKDIYMKAGFPKVTLSPFISMVNDKRKRFLGDSSASFHFQHSMCCADANFFDSIRTVIDASGTDQETGMDSREQEHHHNMEFGGAADDSSQDRRKRCKKGHSFAVESELDARQGPFGKNTSFFHSSPGDKEDFTFEQMQHRDPAIECLNCTANILFVHYDRGWRELGATVELLLVKNTWVLSICHRGESLFTYKAEQSVASGSTNRYTHVMMWKGGKDWSLEFEDRRQWFFFKEMHQLCFQRNTKAASVRHIPIPGVCHVQESVMLNSGHPFVRPQYYICQKQGELDVALSCSRDIYDMDSEDEEWLATKMMGPGPLLNIRDETLEDIIEKLERAAYGNHQDMFSMDVAVNLCQTLGPVDVIKVVHAYWVAKRLRKGMPLIRHFQPAPWERYQKQLQEWEAKVKSIQQDLDLAHKLSPAALPQRPPWFAFCLRPRGLEVLNKVQKQRSQKKLGSGGSIPRHWASAIPLNLATDGLVESPRPADEHPEELLIGWRKAYSQAFYENSGVGASSFGVGDAPPITGGKVRPGNRSDTIINSDIGLRLWRKSSSSGRQRWNSKKIGRRAKKKRIFAMDEDFLPKGKGKSQRQLRMLQNVGISKEIGLQGTEENPSNLTPFCPSFNSWGSFLPKTRDIDPVFLDLDSTNNVSPILGLDLEAVALAKAAIAKKAVDVAARKRAKAQALYAIADAAMRNAVSAMIAADTIEAEKKVRMVLTYQDEQTQLGVRSNKHHHTVNEVSLAPHFGRKKISKLGGGGYVNTEPSVLWQLDSQKAPKSSSNMVLRGSSVKKDLVNNTEDALLPIASWSQELGAGLGTKLIHTRGESPKRNLRHSLLLGTVSDSASQCFEGVA
ncbi:hypothetical protein O6H91_07G005900 [Diphasiastrum complanatum]|uniref:Uncharacterized protein n=1 Tax=Diphasiastrum complanatum TaxID=34168 RepID=A0ACC2D1Y5_DIPCM|nr:hypothetical protein O6H91_07G005900 [Diphasiastrum complanatum]